MKCSIFAAFAAVAVADVPARHALAAFRTHITPALNPVSDPRFFGPTVGRRGDYSTDGRPTVETQFGYPFPKMQDTNDYEKDFVKDENDDDGSWAAQAEYDRLRAKLSKQKAILAGENKEDISDADISDDIGKSTGEVEADVKDLEDCKAKLAEAKEKLKQAIEAVKAAKDAYAAASAEEARVSSMESTARAEEDKLEAEVAKNTQELEDAKAQAKKAKENVAKLEDELEAAAKKVQRFRNPDPDGGVTRRSGAQAGAALSFSAAAATALAQLWS